MLIKNDHSTDKLNQILKINEQINHINDIDLLLDTILYEVRRLINADAGSIFLKKGEVLEFSYVQNYTLAKRDKNNNKHIYSSFVVPINEKSIAGYVALTGQFLMIDDVYQISESEPYSFNKSFDRMSNYRTKSMLVVPLFVDQSKIVGVMQILNKKDDQEKVGSFTKEDKKYISFFKNNCSTAIEKTKMTRENILRMIKMAELRDPKETGAHVNRVAAYSIEIYNVWARLRKIDDQKIKKYKDTLRIAAMLHDVGKIAISDTILKSDKKLNEEEYRIMKSHVDQGRLLFSNTTSDFDVMAAEIAYTHHEKWNGTGYPRGLKGEEIPLSGRIVALADVYDALISRRCYKEPWQEENTLAYIREQAGIHFDPELVDIFISIYDIVEAIRNKYVDNEN